MMAVMGLKELELIQVLRVGRVERGSWQTRL
jgi:hypothetical protein